MANRGFGPSIAVHSVRLMYCLAAVITLLAGITIYVFFRNVSNLVLFRFFPKPGFLTGLPLLVNTGNFAMYGLVFQGPHILWLLSGLFFIRSIWLTQKKQSQIYIAIFTTIAIANEFSQLSHNIPGTFDVRDVLSYGITAFVESVLYHHFIFRRIK